MSFIDSLQERLSNLGEDIVEWTIIILVALVILIVGRWILKLVRTGIERLMGAEALNPVWEKSGVSKALEGSDQTPASLTATVANAYLMIGLLLIVARVVRLFAVADLLERLLAWVPLVLLAAVIVMISASIGNWAANLVAPFAEDKNVSWLTGVVRIGIVLFGALFALDLLEVTFAEDIVKLLVAAAGIALAIAFGVGGIDAGKQWWARHGTPDKLGSSSSGGQSNNPGQSQH